MKIEKGIPIPEARICMKSAYAETVQQMEPGDSVLMETEREADALRQAGITRGYKMRRRKCDNGWRVWVVERPRATVIPLVTPRVAEK